MNQEILDRVLRSPRLPSLPAIAMEVIDLVQKNDVNIRQIADTISHDPALSTKILRTANSSFYGMTQPVSTITHALVVLGLNSVKTLALGFSLVSNLKDAQADGFDHFTFWKRSLYTAVAARAIAREIAIVQQEEVFLGGLLQDLGIFAMSQTLGREYAAIVQQAGGNHRRLRAICQQKLKTDHTEIGAALAEHWKLPPIFVAAIRYHEDPTGCPQELLQVVRCVALGNLIADTFTHPQAIESTQEYFKLAQEWFGLSPERAQSLLAVSHTGTVELRRLFDLPEDLPDNSQDILARANEVLQQLSLQQEKRSADLTQQNQKLAEEATTDSLTGAANRRRFNDFITAEFTNTTKTRKPLSLLFLDTDHFKKFNDTYGHQTGDRVLAEVAATLRKVAPHGSLVARYGGEEFAVVLPDTDRTTAAQIAETARRSIQSTAVVGDNGQPLTVTASFGVATHDGSFFTEPHQLVKAADEGVYAAKGSGRNCVRVFTAKPKAA